MLATERIIDVSSGGVSLSADCGLLRIERGDETLGEVPFADIAAVIISHAGVSMTHGVLCRLAEAGAALVACDGRRLPAAMMLPLQTHYVQGERIALQIEAGQPKLNRIWQQLVRAKIRAQGRLLVEEHGADAGLGALVARVHSADRTNVEAQASRRYWPRLFGDPAFRRNRDADDQNRLLNYGYAVLRAVVARAVCAAGLHPSIGLHHHNRYDAFRLADDLMEPMRPAVDREVVAIVKKHGAGSELTGNLKSSLVEAVLGEVSLDGSRRTLVDGAAHLVASLVAVLSGQSRTLAIPEV